MMPIKQKLKSENGASFLLALLAFLVAAMVCATIITAATSNVKRVHSDRETQQMHLTMTSAAQLVRDAMLDSSYTVTTITIDDEEPKITVTATGAFASEIEAAINYVDEYHDEYDTDASADDMVLSVADTDLPIIDVSFKMSADTTEPYKLLFTLRVQDTGENLYLTMKSSRKTDNTVTESKDKTVTTETTTITWKNPIISGIREES